MISKLLKYDRTLWNVAAVLCLVLGVATICCAGPLSWGIREDSGGTAGSAGIRVGVVAGLLLVASLLSELGARRAKQIVVPIAAVAASLAAAALAVSSFTPFWVGLLAVIPALLGVAGAFATRRVFAYQAEVAEDQQLPRKERKHAAVNPARLAESSVPDVAVTSGLATLLVAVGIIASLSVATMTTWFAPPLPDALQSDGQVVVGVGNKVDVKILYGINYPHTSQLLGDRDGTLAGLVSDGTAQLTLQGVSLNKETRLSVDVREAEACAWENGGADSAFKFATAYNREMAKGNVSSDVADVVGDAGKDMGPQFADCVQSGRYELQAGKSVEGSAKYAEKGLPQVYIEGKPVNPKSLGDLEQMIKDAA